MKLLASLVFVIATSTLQAAPVAPSAPCAALENRQFDAGLSKGEQRDRGNVFKESW